MNRTEIKKLHRMTVRTAEILSKASIQSVGETHVLLYREDVSRAIYLLRKFEEFLEAKMN